MLVHPGKPQSTANPEGVPNGQSTSEPSTSRLSVFRGGREVRHEKDEGIDIRAAIIKSLEERIASRQRSAPPSDHAVAPAQPDRRPPASAATEDSTDHGRGSTGDTDALPEMRVLSMYAEMARLFDEATTDCPRMAQTVGDLVRRHRPLLEQYARSNRSAEQAAVASREVQDVRSRLRAGIARCASDDAFMSALRDLSRYGA
jgi:hypothetical protein